MPSKASSLTTLQCRNSNQPNPMYKNPSSSGNSSSPSCTPFFKHMFMDTTVGHATAIMPTRLCRSSHETAMVSMQTDLPHMSHHMRENEVHQAMAAMGRDMGKLLNYRQLMNSPKNKKAWSLSSANKCGRLSNGIGGRIKNPTNTIEFIFQHKVLADHIKDVTHGQFVCMVRPEKADPTKCNSW
jgi:hypothetical protein